MVVECGFNMAASNTLSTVNGHVEQRRRGCGVAAGGAGLQNNHKAVLSFQCQPSQNHGEHHQDSARLRSNGNCGEIRQNRAEFLSAKDASRRKRVNRSAKLKQHKLDARREQWLSQGSQGKQGKAEQQLQPSNQQQQHRNYEHHHKAGDHGECMAQERAGPSGSSRSQGSGSSGSVCERTPVDSPATHLRSMSNNEGKSSKKEAPSSSRRTQDGRAPHKYFGDEEGNEHKQDLSTNNRRSSSDMSNKSGSNSSCASSSYTGSGSEDDIDESSPHHDAEDDWESAFDALHVQSSPQGLHKGPSSEGKELHDKKQNGGAHHYNPHHPDMMLQSGAQLKPEYKYKNSGFGGRRGNNGGRAWRPDDVSRPPTLPRLTKQHTYSNHSSNSGSHHHQGWGSHMHGSHMWGNQQPATPSYCPICTEELDMTDSSYMPCACGFQLCLFCYHRISSDDGRCPGCRKAYNPESAVKLSRSSSVWLRV